MLDNYRTDSISGKFEALDISSNKYVRLFSVKKKHNVEVLFAINSFISNVAMTYKRVYFVSNSTPNLYDFDIDMAEFIVKVIDDGTNYIVYAKHSNTTNIKIKIIQCNTPNLIKFYPGDMPSLLPSTGDVTKRSICSKNSVYFSILNLISFSFEKLYTTQLILADENEISGHLYVRGNHSGDGTLICTMPDPLYVATESLFQTFTAMYQGTDNLWYGCTLRLGSDGTLKVYGLGSNAPSYISIKANINYRCSVSIVNKFLT